MMRYDEARKHMAENPGHHMIVQGDKSRCFTCESAEAEGSGPGVAVIMSEELVKQLEEWSEPVQIKVLKLADGRFELFARTVPVEVTE